MSHDKSFYLGMLLLAVILAAAFVAPASSQEGYWQCRTGGWSAFTTYRSMHGVTSFECGGICGDVSHSQPTSWVDITGGISQSQQNHSSSFFGPIQGEWNGCTSGYQDQYSTGQKWIEGINQSWDRWPISWTTGKYYMEDLSYLNGHTSNMNQPFASVYDLDCAPGYVCWIWGCSCPKAVIGTVYYDNFPVTSSLLTGDPSDPDVSGYALWELKGDTGVFCSTPANGCENTVCSDLHVRNTFECWWVEPDDNECEPSGECI